MSKRTGHYLSICLPMLVIATGLLNPMAASIAATPVKHFKLSVPDWAHGISDVYAAQAFGCTGGNQSPALHWSGAPAGTKSFVVTLFDRDERTTPSGWWHWALYNIPATTTDLPAQAGAANSKLLPAGAIEGRTDLNQLAYHGPCPDKADPPHHYIMTVYALDVEKLDVDDGAPAAQVTSTAHDHLLGKAVLVTMHGRHP
jgi:Raf kinase inhibitor-like YbhB/YbcL family protein